MKYRSKANPRVTIEAMQWDGTKEGIEVVAKFLDPEDEMLIGQYGPILSISSGSDDDPTMHRVEVGGWALKDANGFSQGVTHEEFEAEWEPLE